MSRAPAPWSWTLLVVVLSLLAQGIAVFNPDFVVVDCEERFNAAHGIALSQGHWDALFALQYRKFCGGCTFDSLLAGLVFSVLPTNFGVWKLVPLSFTAAISLVGFRGLWRLAGPVAASMFIGFLVLAPGTWVRLALLAWGNHYEAGLFCLALAFFAARPPSDRAHLGVGLLAGFALWFGFSSTYAVVGLVGWLIWRRRFGALAWFSAGTVLAPAMWTLQYTLTNQHPFGTIYVEGEAVPALSRIPHKLETLIHPRQLAALFGIPRFSVGIPLGVGALASLTAASVAAVRGLRSRETRTRPSSIFFCILAVWVALYLVVEFTLELRGDGRAASAAGLRYAAPWFPLMWAFLSATGARWWAEGHRRRVGLFVLPFALTGLITKAAVLTGLFPSFYIFQLESPDHEDFRSVHAYALNPYDHMECTEADSRHQAAHAYAMGRNQALGILGSGGVLDALPPPHEPAEHFYAGVGQATVDFIDPDAHGSIPILEEALELLKVLPSDGYAFAVDEAVWWRAHRPEPYGYARGRVGSFAVLERLLKATRPPVDSELRYAALESLGRSWGLSLGRWGLVGTIPFPSVKLRKIDLPGLQAFAHGLGYGLGTKWGPTPTVPSPTGMPDMLRARFVEGVSRGIALQWSERSAPTLADTQPDGTPWEDVGADRWWGDVSNMYCPCRATCW